MALAPSQRPQSVAEWLEILIPPPTPPLQGEGSKNKNNLTPPFPRREGGLGGLGLFSFDTVTVDKYGKINNRRRLEAQYFLEKLNNQVGIKMVSILGGTLEIYKNAPINGKPVIKVHSDNEYRMLRGGSWIGNGRLCRCAYRYRNEPDSRNYSNGFRLVVS